VAGLVPRNPLQADIWTAGRYIAMSSPPTLSITEEALLTALRGFLLPLFQGEVIQGQGNQAAMPKGQFIVMTPMLMVDLSVPVSTFSGQTAVFQSRKKWSVQLDCYDDAGAAHDLATVISTMIRTPYAVDQFAAFGLDMAPLYASDPRNTNMINGESQYQDRWTFEFIGQFNPSLQVTQDAATQLVIGLHEIDTTFPPGNH
jgi:hypothetical protein